ncbi:isochorismatase family protein [Flavobacterium hercynium]|uniref:Isochorismatase-like domain-containing protein n=1 Tax=Flavobacterium hercynium TaxID=387094 RepID=A0A226GQ06_9FLAO|nr:isochorismatase family protein [Flavobacterium hercynium]OXA84093.1 hypothetical protein B0A66_21350 [Flavobacterium hercynium]SMP20845.1 Nicotinamidase-related amidase [Flavobacterium hercynium]
MKIRYSKTALVLLAIQNDYFYKGKMELKECDEVAVIAKKTLAIFRKKRKHIIYVKHLEVKKNATCFVPGTVGAEIYSEVAPIKGEKIIVKNNPNSFVETDLFEYLEQHGIKYLTIVGMMSNMHADTTVRTAKDLGFNVELIGVGTA